MSFRGKKAIRVEASGLYFSGIGANRKEQDKLKVEKKEKTYTRLVGRWIAALKLEVERNSDTAKNYDDSCKKPQKTEKTEIETRVDENK